MTTQPLPSSAKLFAWLAYAAPGSVSNFGIILLVVGALTLPAIGLAYLVLRVNRRRDAFLDLFTQPDIGEFYLASRGRPIRQRTGEQSETFRKRIETECQ